MIEKKEMTILKKDAKCYPNCVFEFLFSTGAPQDSIITFAFNVAGIIEGNESFIHWLIRLMCGTHAHLDKSPQP